MTKWILISLFFVVVNFLFSQVSNTGTPKGWKALKEENNAIPSYKLSPINIDALATEDKINDKLALPWRFGEKQEVSYGLQDGVWSEQSNGDKYWRIKFVSKQALSLNVIFDQFYLPENTELFLYNEDHSKFLGAYTSSQNQENNRLGTWLLEADNIIIEYFAPANVQELPKLHIESITKGYRNAASYDQEKLLNSSGNCNLDVDCSVGSDWDPIKEINKKAVGLLLSGGNSFCTGTLLNNTSSDGKPYFLTANHCYSNPSNWAFRFEWISPNPVCATTVQSTDGPITKTISGGTLRAKNANTDFCLVEINSAIPTSWNLTWVGWDNTDNIPSYVVGIHHPAGDIMKVCRDDSGPIKASNAGAETWEITTAGNGWELGVTEGGSSGSALFDQEGRVIGQLFGGGAACSGTTDNGQKDYYGRFGLSWNGASSSERLKDWLDPTNTNATTLESYPPLQVYNLDASIAISFPEEVCGVTTTVPSLILKNKGVNTLTSATIAWSLNGGVSNMINWSGNLAQNQSESIALGVLSSANGIYNLSSSVSSPNGGVDEFLNNNNSNATFTNSTIGYSASKVFINILTDDYAEETSWEIRNSSGVDVAQGGGFLLDNTIYKDSFVVSVGECYEFEIFDVEDDGICCFFGNGSYTLKTDAGVNIVQGGDFGTSELTEFYISSLNSVSERENSGIIIYPNPTNDVLNVSIGQSSQVNYEFLNPLGAKVLQGVINSQEAIDVSYLAKGVYFLRVKNNAQLIATQKIIIQ